MRCRTATVTVATARPTSAPVDSAHQRRRAAARAELQPARLRPAPGRGADRPQGHGRPRGAGPAGLQGGRRSGQGGPAGLTAPAPGRAAKRGLMRNRQFAAGPHVRRQGGGLPPARRRRLRLGLAAQHLRARHDVGDRRRGCGHAAGDAGRRRRADVLPPPDHDGPAGAERPSRDGRALRPGRRPEPSGGGREPIRRGLLEAGAAHA